MGEPEQARLTRKLLSLNATTRIGSPTQKWRSLRGKYLRIFAEDQRERLEHWYNKVATPTQRLQFRHLVKEVCSIASDPPGVSGELELKATALLRVNGEFLIAPRWRGHVVQFLAYAGAADCQAWRDCFGSVRPISLFGGKSYYKDTFNQRGVEQTAERKRQAEDERAKRRFHAQKLAEIRGLPPPRDPPPEGDSRPPSPAGSTLLLQSSIAVAATAPLPPHASERPLTAAPGTARRRADEVREQGGDLFAGRNTVYQNFFSGSPDRRSKRLKQHAADASQREAARAAKQDLYHRKGGAPWGSFEPLRQQAYLTHNMEAYPDHSRNGTNGFYNYNDNVEADLAQRWRRDQRNKLRGLIKARPQSALE